MVKRRKLTHGQEIAARDAMRGAMLAGWPDQACIDTGSEALQLEGIDKDAAGKFAATIWQDHFETTPPN